MEIMIITGYQEHGFAPLNTVCTGHPVIGVSAIVIMDGTRAIGGTMWDFMEE